MIVRFGLVSGLGWLIDFSLFYLLTKSGAPTAPANFLSAGVAVTFVFFASVRNIFRYEGHYMARKLLAYILYQLCAIAAASYLIQGLCWWFGIAALLAKIVVTPLSFYANFQFMSLISTKKLRLL